MRQAFRAMLRICPHPSSTTAIVPFLFCSPRCAKWFIIPPAYQQAIYRATARTAHWKSMMSYRLGFAADRPRAHVSSKRNWKVALSRVFDYRMQNHVPGAT